MSHNFCKLPAPEKQQPGASSVAHTHQSAEFLPSPVVEGVQAVVRDSDIWEGNFLRENASRVCPQDV